MERTLETAIRHCRFCGAVICLFTRTLGLGEHWDKDQQKARGLLGADHFSSVNEKDVWSGVLRQLPATPWIKT